MLEVEGLVVDRGHSRVLHGIDLRVAAGEIVTLIGPNGAGKTTTLMTLSGLLRPAAGRIRFTVGDEMPDLGRLAPEAIVGHGIVHCPEGRQIFVSLTVRENLLIGAYLRRDGTAIAADLERIFELFPVLAERQRLPAGRLSGGEQMMLALGRALIARPRLLLLDEPSLGLAPQTTELVFERLALINREDGVTQLLVEQNAALALEIASRAYVLETGRVALSGSAAEIADDDALRQTYLGASA